jgi:hypothetical protein
MTLSITVLIAVMLSVVMLNFVMLSVIMLSVVMLRILAPILILNLYYKTFYDVNLLCTLIS